MEKVSAREDWLFFRPTMKYLQYSVSSSQNSIRDSPTKYKRSQPARWHCNDDVTNTAILDSNEKDSGIGRTDDSAKNDDSSSDLDNGDVVTRNRMKLQYDVDANFYRDFARNSSPSHHRTSCLESHYLHSGGQYCATSTFAAAAAITKEDLILRNVATFRNEANDSISPTHLRSRKSRFVGGKNAEIDNLAAIERRLSQVKFSLNSEDRAMSGGGLSKPPPPPSRTISSIDSNPQHGQRQNSAIHRASPWYAVCSPGRAAIGLRNECTVSAGIYDENVAVGCGTGLNYNHSSPSTLSPTRRRFPRMGTRSERPSSWSPGRMQAVNAPVSVADRSPRRSFGANPTPPQNQCKNNGNQIQAEALRHTTDANKASSLAQWRNCCGLGTLDNYSCSQYINGLNSTQAQPCTSVGQNSRFFANFYGNHEPEKMNSRVQNQQPQQQLQQQQQQQQQQHRVRLDLPSIARQIVSRWPTSLNNSPIRSADRLNRNIDSDVFNKSRGSKAEVGSPKAIQHHSAPYSKPEVQNHPSKSELNVWLPAQPDACLTKANGLAADVELSVDGPLPVEILTSSQQRYSRHDDFRRACFVTHHNSSPFMSSAASTSATTACNRPTLGCQFPSIPEVGDTLLSPAPPPPPTVQSGWVVRRRADGTRYIARRRRWTRDRVLRERERRLAEERRSTTTTTTATEDEGQEAGIEAASASRFSRWPLPSSISRSGGHYCKREARRRQLVASRERKWRRERTQVERADDSQTQQQQQLQIDGFLMPSSLRL